MGSGLWNLELRIMKLKMAGYGPLVLTHAFSGGRSSWPFQSGMVSFDTIRNCVNETEMA
jgi:hypothetical protein